MIYLIGGKLELAVKAPFHTLSHKREQSREILLVRFPDKYFFSFEAEQ